MGIKMNRYLVTLILSGMVTASAYGATENIIEKQLKEIGSIEQEETVIVQRKYTRKVWRHELTPVQFGGVPFGTVRRTLFGGAGYTLHITDWFAWEAVNILYTRNFFSNFTEEINANKATGPNPNQADIRPDIQKLLFIGTTGFQITPFYGKVSTFSKWIAYLEPYFAFGVGWAKTETRNYVAFFPGIGIRVFFREWVSMRFEFRDYMYTEKFQTRETPPQDATAFRNNYAVMLSLSFWLPKMPKY